MKITDKNLYREIFERSGDAIFVVDPVGESFVDVNERACELLGYDYSTLMSLGPLGVHPHEVDAWRTQVTTALRDESVITTELSCRTASGDLLPVEVTSTAIEIEDKQCLIFAVRDLTSRLQMQQALRESEERYRNLVDMSPDAILVNQDGTVVFINTPGANMLGAEHPSEIIDTPILEFIAPEYRELVKDRTRRVIEHGETAPPAEVELLRLNGSRRFVEGKGKPINFQGEKAVQVVLRDISERKRMEHERFVLAEIGDVVGSTLAIVDVYERFAKLVESLIPFDRIVISEFDLASDTITPVYVSGHRVASWEVGIAHPISDSRLGPTIYNRDSLLFDAKSTADHAAANPDNSAGAAAGFTTGLAVPLIVRDQVIGVLNLSSSDPNVHKFEHLEMLSLVANQIAPAVENARLYKQAAKFAVLEERNRLARDLHDSVAQSLYSLTLYSEASVRYAQVGDLDKVQMNLSQIGESALQALREMRLLVHELRPQELDDEGLISALQHRLDAVEGRSGIKARLILDAKYDLPDEIENVLFPVALEALNNTLKHSSASAVEMRVDAVDDGVELTVSDDGRGFEVSNVSAQSGIGLSSMSERLKGVGGTLSVKSVIGKGTTVRAFVKARDTRRKSVEAIDIGGVK
jgi:PAS domain S-box-containing protein